MLDMNVEDKPHDYLPDIVDSLKSGKLFIAEAGMEDDKRGNRNLPTGRTIGALDHRGSHAVRTKPDVTQWPSARSL